MRGRAAGVQKTAQNRHHGHPNGPFGQSAVAWRRFLILVFLFQNALPFSIFSLTLGAIRRKGFRSACAAGAGRRNRGPMAGLQKRRAPKRSRRGRRFRTSDNADPTPTIAKHTAEAKPKKDRARLSIRRRSLHDCSLSRRIASLGKTGERKKRETGEKAAESGPLAPRTGPGDPVALTSNVMRAKRKSEPQPAAPRPPRSA